MLRAAVQKSVLAQSLSIPQKYLFSWLALLKDLYWES